MANESRLLDKLFDSEAVRQLDAYNAERNVAMKEFFMLWRNPDFEAEKAHLALSGHLVELFESYPTVALAPKRKDINAAIKWSSSKFNEYTKSQFVEIVLKMISRESAAYASDLFTAGSYGAGGTGNASSNYEVKGAGGDYTLISYDHNTYIFDGNTVFNFTSNRPFVIKHALSESSCEFKSALSDARKAFDKKWPVKHL